jgi:DNA repair protein RecO (recombination protein O)
VSEPQPAWVLSRKNYGDNGLLVEFFSADLGRCGAIVRGAHRRKQGGSLASLLQPFHPLLVTLAGRGELKTLRMAEAPAPGYLLRGDAMMSGLYLNELLARILPRFDALPALFVAYGRAVESLFHAPGEESLRRFELVLLSELGYRIDWDSDERRESIRSDAYYRFEPDRGFCRVEAHAPIVHNEPLLSGEQMLAFRQWWEAECMLPVEDLMALKRITRAAVGQLTGGRVIHTREFFRDLKVPARRES